MENSKRLIEMAEQSQFLLQSADASGQNIQFSDGVAVVGVAWVENASIGKEEVHFTVSRQLPLLEQAYLEAFARLAAKLPWQKILLLGTREIENFLRDDNLNPAHIIGDQNQPGLWLESLRTRVMEAWFEYRFTRILSPGKIPESATDIESLAKKMLTLNHMAWGDRALVDWHNSQIVGITPFEGSGVEIIWNFPSSIVPLHAQQICLALESVLKLKGIRGKVVAES